MATMIAGLAEFERDLLRERVRSGLAAARARGKKLGRQPGQRPKSDRYAARVMALVDQGLSHRLIARDLGLSKTPSWASYTAIAPKKFPLCPLSVYFVPFYGVTPSRPCLGAPARHSA